MQMLPLDTSATGMAANQYLTSVLDLHLAIGGDRGVSVDLAVLLNVQDSATGRANGRATSLGRGTRKCQSAKVGERNLRVAL